MKWQIPAKTFALGEYVALQGGPAILLLTEPQFVMHLEDKSGGLQGIHPHSPAGKFWLSQGFEQTLRFEDPYEGRGGFGASSAQFVGAYLAYCELRALPFDREDLLQAYQRVVEVGSGYDVLAQSTLLYPNRLYPSRDRQGADINFRSLTVAARKYPNFCVYIHRQAHIFEPFEWPFKHLHFSLIHTGQKCQTHQHLAALQSISFQHLATIVQAAKTACDQQDEHAFADAINQYHDALFALGLMSSHSDQKVRELRQQADVLAAKGCGAMGADVLLSLTQ